MRGCMQTAFPCLNFLCTKIERKKNDGNKTPAHSNQYIYVIIIECFPWCQQNTSQRGSVPLSLKESRVVFTTFFGMLCVWCVCVHACVLMWAYVYVCSHKSKHPLSWGKGHMVRLLRKRSARYQCLRTSTYSTQGWTKILVSIISIISTICSSITHCQCLVSVKCSCGGRHSSCSTTPQSGLGAHTLPMP